MFRPDENMARLLTSAARMALPVRRTFLSVYQFEIEFSVVVRPQRPVILHK
jgi:branched-subunit amino acid aminotransferase/4-amino-4-deoxychorismate lyase